MNIFFSIRQLPECAGLSEDQIRRVSRECLAPRFDSTVWVIVAGVMIFGTIGRWVGSSLGGGSSGAGLLGGLIPAVVVALTWVPVVLTRSRPEIREFLRARAPQEGEAPANKPTRSNSP